MVFRGANRAILKLRSDDRLFLDDEGRKDSVKLVLTILSDDDDHKITVAENLTREQADTLSDFFYTALLNEEDNIDMMNVLGPVQ